MGLKGVLCLLLGTGALLLFPVTTFISREAPTSDPAELKLRRGLERRGKGPSVTSIRAASPPPLSHWGTVRSWGGHWWRGDLQWDDGEGKMLWGDGLLDHGWRWRAKKKKVEVFSKFEILLWREVTGEVIGSICVWEWMCVNINKTAKTFRAKWNW